MKNLYWVRPVCVGARRAAPRRSRGDELDLELRRRAVEAWRAEPDLMSGEENPAASTCGPALRRAASCSCCTG